MSWQPSLSWELARERSQIISKIRNFFNDRNVIEVETPLLCSGTITDIHIDVFSTEYDSLSTIPSKKFLQTSPEFAMKRLLASGYGDIYQICKAFRNEGAGSHHNPEFTILEWYRLGFDHFKLIDEVEALLQTILDAPEGVRISYQKVFKQYTGIDPLATNTQQLKKIVHEAGLMSGWLESEEDLDTLLQFVFSEVVEKNFDFEVPYFVYDFPVTQASLAKVSNEDSRVAHRFECYYRGLELANGFYELTDDVEQLNRFKLENLQRIEAGFEGRPIDLKLIDALKSGLPQCSGVAVGIDRIIMLALNRNKIEDVITFSIKNA